MVPVGETSQEASYDDKKTEIHAIYCHVGLGASLLQIYSEGVLLLPASDMGSVFEGIVVANAIGMLRLSREMGSEKEKERRRYLFGFVRDMLRRAC